MRWRDDLSEEEKLALEGVEECVRRGLSGFIASVAAQLTGHDEQSLECGLYLLSARVPGLLERQAEGVCPACGDRLRAVAGRRNLPCICGSTAEPGGELHYFYVPRGELARAVPKPLAYVPSGPRLRASALAAGRTKAMSQNLSPTLSACSL